MKKSCKNSIESIHHFPIEALGQSSRCSSVKGIRRSRFYYDLWRIGIVETFFKHLFLCMETARLTRQILIYYIILGDYFTFL